MIILAQKLHKGRPLRYDSAQPNVIHPITHKPIKEGDVIVYSFNFKEWEDTMRYFPKSFQKITEASETKIYEPDVTIEIIEPSFDEGIDTDSIFSLDRSVSDIIAEIKEENDIDFLNEILTKESEGKNRKAILKAIDKRIDFLNKI